MGSEASEKPVEEFFPTLWHVLQKIGDESISDDERKRLFALIQEKQENRAESTKEMLRYGLVNKNFEVLKFVIRYLENNVQGKLKCSPTSDKDIQEIIDSGEGTIFVGSGSLGGRIHIKKDRVFMNEDKPEYDGEVRSSFQRIFGLTGDQLEVML